MILSELDTDYKTFDGLSKEYKDAYRRIQKKHPCHYCFIYAHIRGSDGDTYVSDSLAPNATVYNLDKFYNDVLLGCLANKGE